MLILSLLRIQVYMASIGKRCDNQGWYFGAFFALHDDLPGTLNVLLGRDVIHHLVLPEETLAMLHHMLTNPRRSDIRDFDS